jgi:hypothetical protein
MLDPKKLTSKVQAALSSTVELARENGHQQFTSVHLACVLLEDPQGERRLGARGEEA